MYMTGGDFDGDGLPDNICAGLVNMGAAATRTVHLGNGNDALAAIATAELDQWCHTILNVEDVNADGKDDLICRYGDDGIWVKLSDSDGSTKFFVEPEGSGQFGLLTV